MGYCLVLFHRGTSLARLYSIAIATHSRGLGLGKQLLDQAEHCARAHDCAYLRLEVRPDNPWRSVFMSATVTDALLWFTTTTKTMPMRCVWRSALCNIGKAASSRCLTTNRPLNLPAARRAC